MDTPNLHRNKRSMSAFLWMFISETLLVSYMFFVVPKNADVHLWEFILGPFLFEPSPLPSDLYYILPMLLYIGIVIIVLGNFRFPVWILGVVVLYIESFLFLIITEENNAFGLGVSPGWSAGFAVVGVAFIVIPFWCIFFFLWELLFCGIAKWWRKRRENPEADEPHK